MLLCMDQVAAVGTLRGVATLFILFQGHSSQPSSNDPNVLWTTIYTSIHLFKTFQVCSSNDSSSSCAVPGCWHGIA